MIKMWIRVLFLRSPSRKEIDQPKDDDLWLPQKRIVAPRNRNLVSNRNLVAARTASTPAIHTATISGKCYVIDGDTIQIGKVRIRLAGIDAPELDHPWGIKAKWALVELCKGQTITAKLEPDMSHDRAVATCFLADGRDLSAEMVRCGLALDWPKFSGGRYSHLEPMGARKKHWKAAARQKGHMRVFHK